MAHLIDRETQLKIAGQVNEAVDEVLDELPNLGGEENITPVLGNALKRKPLQTANVQVKFNYRVLSKHTEEPRVGADGALLVRVVTPRGEVEKVALFQAKLLKGEAPARDLSMKTAEANKLADQAKKMLAQTEEAVALFYTRHNMYVVDAALYDSQANTAPLSEGKRLITLGTYLGSWIPRCTRGDQNPNLIKRAHHLDGFKHGLTMDVIVKHESIRWKG